MIGLGSAIGAGLKAVGSIAGGIAAGKAMREVKNNINEQRTKNQEWYDQRYNEDATQRGDAQRMLTLATDAMKSNARRAAGAQAVMGGSEESVAAAKAAGSRAIADATSNIVAAADARKDNIEQQYQTNDANYVNQLNNLAQTRAANIASAAQGVAETGAQLSGFGVKEGA
jgi:hypothetical protein